jgi:hypothetical protein
LAWIPDRDRRDQVVICELSGTGPERQRRGLRLIGYAFAALAVYLMIGGILAAAVLLGLVLNAGLEWCADPAAGYVIVYYAAREVRQIFSGLSDLPSSSS